MGEIEGCAEVAGWEIEPSLRCDPTAEDEGRSERVLSRLRAAAGLTPCPLRGSRVST